MSKSFLELSKACGKRGGGAIGWLAMLFLAYALAAPRVHGAIKATDIQGALDTPQGVTFSAPGNYSGSNGDWTVTTATIPKEPANIKGKVTFVGKSCLTGNVPSAKGYENYWNLRSRNYFTVTVQGPGTLTFKYRTSLDDYTDAKLVAYLYDGNNAKALQAEEYDDPDDETEAEILPFEVLFEDSGYWSEYSERWGEMVYDLTAADFWETATLKLDTDAYTHVITIAVVGSAKYDRRGNEFGSYILDDDYDGYVQENRVYLDDMVWTPDPLPAAVLLSEESGTTFVDSMTVYVDSDYDLEAFDFHYTTDGTQPTLESAKISWRENTGDDDDDDDWEIGDDDDDDGIVLTDDCTLWVRAYEAKSATWVGEAKADYHRVAPTPEVALSPLLDFSDTTTLEFAAPSENTLTYYYTLDGTEPTTSSTKADGGIVTLANAKLAGKTLKVIAVENDGHVSPVTACPLTRSPAPTLSWQTDGVDSQETCFVDSVQVRAAGDAAFMMLNPASGMLTATGTVQAVAFADGMLASQPASQSFVRLDALLPTTAEGLFGPGAALSSWGFFTLPGVMSETDRRALTEFLRPFSVNRSVFARATSLELGQTYLIWLPAVDFESAPPTLRYASGTAVPVTGSGWHLVPSGARWTWDGRLHEFVPVPTEDSSQAGWRNGD